MRKKNEYTKLDKFETILQPGTVLEGKLSFSKPIRMRGKFVGDITADGILYIDKEAEVIANIDAKEVIISGKVTGDINASERIEIMLGGNVKGDLKSSRIRISDDVVFQGSCNMIKDPESIDVFSTNAEKLKEIALSV